VSTPLAITTPPFRPRRKLPLPLRFRGGCFGRLRGLRCGTFAAELLDAGVDQPDEVLKRRVEQADDRVERRGDRPQHLAAQLVERRQLGEALDVGRRDRSAVEDASPDREHLRLAGGRADRFGDGNGIAVGLEKRDRGRAIEQREQRVGARGLGRAAGQRVLHDGELRPVLEQLGAETVDLGHRQPAVVRDDQRLARLEPIGQVCDDLLLVLFLHCHSLRND